jgi:hypothetical protein
VECDPICKAVAPLMQSLPCSVQRASTGLFTLARLPYVYLSLPTQGQGEHTSGRAPAAGEGRGPHPTGGTKALRPEGGTNPNPHPSPHLSHTGGTCPLVFPGTRGGAKGAVCQAMRGSRGEGPWPLCVGTLSRHKTPRALPHSRQIRGI